MNPFISQSNLKIMNGEVAVTEGEKFRREAASKTNRPGHVHGAVLSVRVSSYTRGVGGRAARAS